MSVDVTALPRRLRRSYAVVSSALLTAILLFAVLNVVAWPFSHRAHPSQIDQFGFERVLRAYPGRKAEDVRALLAEMAAHREEYEPFTDFRPVPTKGRFVNIHPAGFRAVAGQAPWPPEAGNTNVFFFGGSTAFGYGLPDEEAIPSRLQQLLLTNRPSLRVYNFGRPGYFSSQERVLFEQLVASGTRPGVVVFLDGMNEFVRKDDPGLRPPWASSYSERLRRLDAESRQHETLHLLLALMRRLPLTRALARPRDDWNELAEWNDPPSAGEIVARYLRNRALLEGSAAASTVRALFVWQPSPVFRYDLAYHLFADAELRRLTRSTAGYELLDPAREPAMSGPDVLWLGDLQVGRKENLYVDRVHYDAAFSRVIAERIAKRLDALLGQP